MKKGIIVCFVLLLLLCGCSEVKTLAETTAVVETTQDPTIEETQAPTEPLTEEGIPVNGEFAFSIAYIDQEGRNTIIRYSSGVYGGEEGYGSEVFGKYEYNPESDVYYFSDLSDYKSGYSGVAVLEGSNLSLKAGDTGIGYYCKGGKILPMEWEVQDTETISSIDQLLSFTFEDRTVVNLMKLGSDPYLVMVEDLNSVGYGTSEPDVLKDAGIEPTIVGK